MKIEYRLYESDDDTLSPTDGTVLPHGRCDGCGYPEDWYDVKVPGEVYEAFLDQEKLLATEDDGEVSIGAIIAELVRMSRGTDE